MIYSKYTKIRNLMLCSYSACYMRGFVSYTKELALYLKNRDGLRFKSYLVAANRAFVSYKNGDNIHKSSYQFSNDRAPEFANKVEFDSSNISSKLIAFYLPQFHPFAENSEWWGEGFTEWTNVTKAQPQFLGHRQPNLPADLGFYDLRLKDTIQEQASLARNYGIHGFCFHLYWFSGRRLMEKPLDIFLNNSDIDINFSICWANENWTRRWDGNEDDVLIGQKHSFESDKEFIHDVRKYLIDPRYIKLDGKKIITIYRPSIIPNIKELVSYWKEYCRKDEEIGETLFIMAKSFDQEDPEEYGFDLAVEFPPHQLHTKINPIDPGNYLNEGFKGIVYSYGDVVDCKVNEYYTDGNKSYIPTVFPSWDNEARKPGKGNVFHASTPQKYQEWLEAALHKGSNIIPNESVAFINAWNEWAEGAYLEPDRKFGHAYLQSTYYAAVRHSLKDALSSTQSKFVPTSKNLVVLHLHYLDLFDEISAKLDNIDNFDLMISIGSKVEQSDIDKILLRYPQAVLFGFENRGRDIRPFFEILKFCRNFDYENVLKVHSKKSLHRIDGDNWRQGLIDSLCGSQDTVNTNLSLLEQCSLVAPKNHLFSNQSYLGSNLKLMEAMVGSENAKSAFVFPAGSMYWVKFSTIQALSDRLSGFELVFEPEHGQLDGTFAHAIERYTGFFIEHEESGQLLESNQ